MKTLNDKTQKAVEYTLIIAKAKMLTESDTYELFDTLMGYATQGERWDGMAHITQYFNDRGVLRVYVKSVRRAEEAPRTLV